MLCIINFYKISKVLHIKMDSYSTVYIVLVITLYDYEYMGILITLLYLQTLK